MGIIYTKQEMLELLRMKVKELGRFPLKREINADSRLPSSETYRNYFGNLPQLASTIGISPYDLRTKRVQNRDEVLAKIKELAQSLGRMPTEMEINDCPYLPSRNTIRRHFGPLSAISEKIGFTSFKRHYTDAQLLELLKSKAQKIGKTPTLANISKDKDMPCIHTYMDRFGNYSNVLRLAGLPPNRRGRKTE